MIAASSNTPRNANNSQDYGCDHKPDSQPPDPICELVLPLTYPSGHRPRQPFTSMLDKVL